MRRTSGVALFLVLTGCSDPESPSGTTGGSAGQAGGGAGGKGGSSAGAGLGGSSGDGAGGSAGSSTGGKGGSGGSAGSSTGGKGGSGGSAAGAGNAGVGGSSASAGTGGISPGCECPTTAPFGGEACAEDCSGPPCAYEDCDGEGFIQAVCTGEWIVIQQACGDKPCGNDITLTCAPGTVCIQVVGGAISGDSCVPHECDTGPITCDCLGSSCPGECTQVGGTTFTCNTCPSGLCP